MTRLIVVVEGQTEEAFVNDVLAPHLLKRDVYATATIVGKVNAQRRGHRGRGGGHFRHWRRDLERILGNDRNADLRVTTLFDLYGLPEDFPGSEEYGRDTDTNRRCDAFQVALGDAFATPRPRTSTTAPIRPHRSACSSACRATSRPFTVRSRSRIPAWPRSELDARASMPGYRNSRRSGSKRLSGRKTGRASSGSELEGDCLHMVASHAGSWRGCGDVSR